MTATFDVELRFMLNTDGFVLLCLTSKQIRSFAKLP